ncbi:MAG: DMT family transporter [Ruminococcus sp.]|nr:DMT family transporter [Ruminococcus sp.]
MLKNLKGNFILFIAALIWGTCFVAQSEGMDFVEPFTYNATRTLIGGLTLLPVIFCFKFLGKKKETREKLNIKVSLIGGVFCGLALCVASSLQQIGIVYTTAGKSGFITALYVIIVPLFQLVCGKNQPKRIWICVALAILGFYLLCIKGDFTVSVGDLLTLGCACVFAVHITVIDRFLKKGADGMIMSCVQFWVAGLIMLIPMFMFETPSIEGIYNARYTILYAGVLSSGIAYTLQIIGQRFTAPTTATLIMSLESVFAALSGWLILGEQLSFKEFFGCALVFIAVIVAQIEIPKLKRKSTLE